MTTKTTTATVSQTFCLAFLPIALLTAHRGCSSSRRPSIPRRLACPLSTPMAEPALRNNNGRTSLWMTNPSTSTCHSRCRCSTREAGNFTLPRTRCASGSSDRDLDADVILIGITFGRLWASSAVAGPRISSDVTCLRTPSMPPSCGSGGTAGMAHRDDAKLVTPRHYSAFWDDLAMANQPWQGVWWQFTSTGIVVGHRARSGRGSYTQHHINSATIPYDSRLNGSRLI